MLLIGLLGIYRLAAMKEGADFQLSSAVVAVEYLAAYISGHPSVLVIHVTRPGVTCPLSLLPIGPFRKYYRAIEFMKLSVISAELIYTAYIASGAGLAEWVTCACG